MWLKGEYGCVFVWEVYLICLYVLCFFDGCLLDFNFGMLSGVSVVLGFVEVLVVCVFVYGGYMVVVNGCFKGGYIM